MMFTALLLNMNVSPPRLFFFCEITPLSSDRIQNLRLYQTFSQLSYERFNHMCVKLLHIFRIYFYTVIFAANFKYVCCFHFDLLIYHSRHKNMVFLQYAFAYASPDRSCWRTFFRMRPEDTRMACCVAVGACTIFYEILILSCTPENGEISILVKMEKYLY